MQKLSNKSMIDFLNATDGLRKKKMPLKMAFAIRHNTKLLFDCYKPYDEMRVSIMEEHKEDSVKCAECLSALLLEEIEVAVKRVPLSVVELSDNEDYDSLTLGELEAIEFMIEE